ncbi:phytase [Sphingomonas sp. RB56-2]|uniref:Phytase n=2 Tax=Sphingomonas brevis TaxID=2908206 RepID=A0ABT0S8Z3_9SPHN|nr:phytase [Sphingomonas brevis]
MTTQQGGANRAVVVTDGPSSSIVGTAELAGLEIYDSAGKRTGSIPAGEAVGVDVRYGSLPGFGSAAVLLGADATSNSLRFYRAQGGSLTEISARSVPLGIAVEGGCLYRSSQDGSLYAFALGDGGEIDQYLLFEPSAGRVDAKLMRRLHVASTVEHCVADDSTGQLYVSEQAVGIWRFNAEPETEILPVLIDAVRLGKINEEVGGLALYDGGGSARWLIASNASAGQLYAYDHAKDDAYVGALTVTSAGEAVREPGGLFATSAPLGSNQGALIIGDEDGSNYKIVPFGKIAQALGINAGSPQPLIAAVAPTLPIVHPSVETDPVTSAADAADDPAIWANSSNPAASWVIGTDKQGGLHVYDMQGKSRFFAADGKMNNVDIRSDYRLAGRDIVLVTASDRTNKAIAIYSLDTETGALTNIADGIQQTGLSDPYGQCMYRSKRGRTYVFISDPDGLVRQWELVPTRGGKVQAKHVRDIKFSSQTEGCVVDDDSGTLYVAEEDIGLWRVTAEPVKNAAPVSIDRIADNPKLKDDMEGVGLYDLGGGRGYLIVSSQGNNSYAVYRREGENAYLGSFSVIADPAKGIDGISETDGLDVSSANLGPGFEHGAMIAQDGRNMLPVQNQNFKYVPWATIAATLNLESRR